MHLLVFLFGILGGYLFCKVLVWVSVGKLHRRAIIKGYHFHHSLGGKYTFILALFFSGNIALFLWGSGIGIIIEHTLMDGLVFITKE